MLNLKELENQLDQALAKETEESLTTWLLEKRAKSYLAQLGLGQFEKKKTLFEEYTIESTSVSIEIEVFEIECSHSYLTTAA